MAGVTEIEEPVQAAPDRRLELIFAGLALLVSLVVLFLASQITSKVDAGGLAPRHWPLLLSATAVLLSIGLLIKAVRSDGEEREGLNEASRAGWVQVGAAVAAAIVFLVLWDVIGFEIACVAFLVGLLLIFGVRSPLWLVAFPVGLTALIYLLFRLLLRVPL